MARYTRLAMCAALLAAGLVGCAGQAPRTPVGVMDNPAHHFNTGLGLLDAGDVDGAEAEFTSASSMGTDYPPAMAGLGLVAALRGGKGAESRAMDLVDDARDAADDWEPEVRMWPEVMEIRALTALFGAGLLEREEFLEGLEPPFEDAVELMPGAPEPYFHLAEAHVAALDFVPAEGLYLRVLEMGRGYEERAEARWRLVQDVNRAAPGTTAGKRIALIPALTRADLAALLAEELDVDKFYTRTSEAPAASFAAPGRATPAAPAATDLAGHPLGADVAKVLAYGVRGLGLYPDGTFRPDEPVTRAEAAMIFEDVVVRATGKGELGTQFIGQPSPLPDLGGDHPAYNAAMLCLTRGVMDADVRSGAFRPLDAVSGVEALLAVQALRRDLSLF